MFREQLVNKIVLIQMDNQVTMFYINKQGGTGSYLLCWQVVHLWKFAFSHGMVLRTMYLPGELNILADHLSRVLWLHEWTICRMVASHNVLIWGTLSIDLFAILGNPQVPLFCSRVSSSHWVASEAFLLDWREGLLYA